MALSVERENGLPISYACRKGATSEQQRNLTLSFQYEFAVTDPEEDIGAEVIIQTLPALEYYILYYVAEAVGVLSCELENQNILGNLEYPTLSDRPNVVGISNANPDHWESNITCTGLTNLPPRLVCVPLQGTMMAYFVGPEDEANAVEQFLSDHIARVINGPQVLRNGVEQASFIGSRLVSSSETKGTSATSTAERKSLIPATLGGSAAAGLVIGLFSAFFIVRRRRRRADQRSEFIPEIPLENKVVTKPALEPTQSESDRAEFDPENPSTTKNGDPDTEVPSINEPQLATIATARTASETIDGSTTPTHDVPNESAPAGVTTADNTTRELPSEINIKPREEENASSPGSSKPPIPMVPKPPPPPVPSPAALLSKPPTAPKPPVARTPTPPPGTLKKKRRRKKKKKGKKAVLVRVNSRENMREMETITEAVEEEVVEDNISEYSWYSTSDSCCSVGSHSRDPSPSPMDMSGETIETNQSQDLGSFDTGDEADQQEEEGIVDHQDLKTPALEEVPSTESEQPAASTSTEEHESMDIPSAATTEETSPEIPHNESIEVLQDEADDDVYIQEPATMVPQDSETVTTGDESASRTTNDGEETVTTTGDGSSTISSSRATNDDTEGSTMPPIPSHWV